MRKILLMFFCLALIVYNAQAQTPLNFDPPDLKIVDDAGINLISGKPQVHIEPVSIGPKDSGLTFKLDFNGDATRLNFADGFWGEISMISMWVSYQSSVNALQVRMFGHSDLFTGNSTSDIRNSGAILNTKADGSYEYITRDGVRYLTDPSIKGPALASSVNQAITKIIYPNGRKIDISRSQQSGTPVISVTANNGYQLRYTYDASGKLSRVTAINLAVDYCDANVSACSYSLPWPSASFVLESNIVNFNGPTKLTITDSANKVATYYSEDGQLYGSHYTRLTKAKWTTSQNAETIVYNYGAGINKCFVNGSSWDCSTLRDSPVMSVNIGDRVWKYTYTQQYLNPPYQAGLDGVWWTEVTSPAGLVTDGLYDIRRNTISTILVNGGSSETYDGYRVKSSYDNEGRQFSFSYDGRSNILTKTQTSTENATPIVLEVNYDANCINPVTCNRPNWTKDERKNQTDYVFDPVHGGILKETLPADSNGIRAQKRYKYIQRTAMIKNSSGGYTPASGAIWMLDSMSYCRTSTGSDSGCQIPNDEVITRYDYGPTTGPNNLLLRGVTLTADGISHRTCYTYDSFGNKTSETTANAGLSSCY